jgi:hypothetical protein
MHGPQELASQWISAVCKKGHASRAIGRELECSVREHLKLQLLSFVLDCLVHLFDGPLGQSYLS